MSKCSIVCCIYKILNFHPFLAFIYYIMAYTKGILDNHKQSFLLLWLAALYCAFASKQINFLFGFISILKIYNETDKKQMCFYSSLRWVFFFYSILDIMKSTDFPRLQFTNHFIYIQSFGIPWFVYTVDTNKHYEKYAEHFICALSFKINQIRVLSIIMLHIQYVDIVNRIDRDDVIT